jgi:hypothetical protein
MANVALLRPNSSTPWTHRIRRACNIVGFESAIIAVSIRSRTFSTLKNVESLSSLSYCDFLSNAQVSVLCLPKLPVFRFMLVADNWLLHPFSAQLLGT